MVDEFDVQEQPEEGALKKLKALAQEAVDAEQLIADLEDNINGVKKRLLRLKTVELPSAISTVGIPKFTTDDGWEIEIDDFISGSLPKDPTKRESAIEWCEDSGNESLIKTTLVLSFGRRQHNEALALVDDLHQKGFDVEVNSGIHAETLKAFAREALRKGDQIPLETLGLFAGRVAKIKAPPKDEKR